LEVRRDVEGLTEDPVSQLGGHQEARSSVERLSGISGESALPPPGGVGSGGRPATLASPSHRSTAAAAAALAIATVALFLVSRGKWSDAIVDTGTEWIYADALARGQMLYRDVVYWFGPFTPYFQAGFFRLFGSSFSTLALCGLAGAFGVLGALHFALRRVTGRREAMLWTALAIPALVFMPNSGGAILGMGYRIWHPAGFALLGCGLASQPGLRKDTLRCLGAGVCAGLAGLCRTEWGVITLVSVFAAEWVRLRSTARLSRDMLLTAAAAFVTFGATLGGFAAAVGPAALLRDAPVLLMGIPRDTPAGSVLATFRGWRDGIPVLLYSAALWIGIASLAGVLAARGISDERVKRWLRLLLAALAAMALLAAAGAAWGAILFSAAPLICLAALAAGLARQRGPRAAALAAFGCMGLLASHRRLFHIGDSGYVAPPLLFALVCAAGLLRRLVVLEKEQLLRFRFRAIVDGALVLLIGLAFLGRTIQYSSDERVPVPGTGGMLSALPGTARDLALVAAMVRAETSESGGLVVLPEGGVLNYLAGRPNSMRYKISIPGYLRESNEEDFLRDLQRARPAAIVIVNRPAGEYGRGLFGQGYGERTRRWIERHYFRRPVPAAAAVVFTIAPGRS
jgi:hypothetical protein